LSKWLMRRGPLPKRPLPQWLREPLLHFVLLGFGLFLLYGWVGGRANGEGSKIVITAGHIEQLRLGFERMQQRLPEPAELDALIDDAIREEIYYREAKALGLDRDDTIVRRRLRQKLEFVSEDVAPMAEATDAELQVYLEANPERFRRERRYSLSQVYVDAQQRGSRSSGDVQGLLAELRSAGPDADLGGRGDASLLPQRFDAMRASELSRLFGAVFEGALHALPLGEWTGPVPSGYGVHLVLLRERDEERVASLAEVREDVRREWMRTRHADANARFYEELRQRYVVTVARPAPSEALPSMPTGLR
jgi:parvulin-like peptidyl-prolyl cis-trans isomerase-like protein